MTGKILNGFDVAALFDTIDAIKEDPDVADFTFRARNFWINGGENHTEISSYYSAHEERRRKVSFRIMNDEPPELLGTDKAPNPVEYLLHALAGCVTTGIALQAAVRGIALEEIETHFEGDLDMHGLLGLCDKTRNGFETIRLSFRIKGNAHKEKLEELGRMAIARSPVFDMLSNGVPIEVEMLCRRTGDEAQVA